MSNPGKPWRTVTRPLTLTVRRRWSWGADPRRENAPLLISPRGSLFECRWVRNGTCRLLARPYTPNAYTA